MHNTFKSVHPDSTVLPVPAALTVEVDISALWEGSRQLPKLPMSG